MDVTTVSAMKVERVSALVPFFVVSIIIPNAVILGPVRLSPSLTLILVCFVPMIVLWLGRRIGPIMGADLLILASATWASVALLYHYGVAGIESAGRTVLEVFGAYHFGRCVIRGPKAARAMIRCYLLVLMLLLPFAFVEALTGLDLYLKVSSFFAPSYQPAPDATRLGLYRVQTAFEHPIHYGLFASSLIALVFIMPHHTRIKAVGAALSSVSTFFSLSTGPLFCYIVQMGLLVWSWLLRTPWRWILLAALLLATYIIIDLFSNRTPFHVFVTYLTLNSESAYARINIWYYGSSEVIRYPLFGIGYNDWERPAWMSSSVDMFWLRYAMQHGMPASVFLGAGCLFLMVQAGLKRHLASEAVLIRRGLIICLVGIFTAVWSVDLWRIMLVWTMFLTGSLGWIVSAAPPSYQRRSSEIDQGPKEPQDAPSCQRKLEANSAAKQRSLL